MVSNTTANLVVCILFTAATLTSVTVAWRYAEAGVNRSAFFATCLGFTVGLSTVILVPYDVWSASVRTEEAQAPLSQDSIRHGWAFVYWTTVVVCYFLIPVLMEFESAGDFRFHKRLKTALKRNLVWYLVYLVLAAGAYIFLPSQWYSEDGVENNSLHSMLGFGMAVSQTVGLMILTILMGFGLVALPRSLWRASDQIGKLTKLYADLATQNAVKQAAVARLKEAILQTERDIEPYNLLFKQAVSKSETVYGSKQNDRHVHEALDVLNRAVAGSKDLCKQLGFANEGRESGPRNTWTRYRPFSSSASLEDQENISFLNRAILNNLRRDDNAGNDPERSIVEQMDKKQLASDIRDLTKLHTSLKSLNLQARRASHRFQKLTHKCIVLEDLDGLVDEAQRDTRGSQWSERLQLYAASWSHTRHSWLCCSTCCRRLLRKSYWARAFWRQHLLFWHRRLRPIMLKTVSCSAGVLSFFIVLAQLTMFSDSFWFCSLFAVIIRSYHGFWATHVICLLPLGYMGYAVAWSVFRMRIFNWYGLYPGHNTDSNSLLWCTTIVTRLSVPLGYHFLYLIRVASTSFEDFMRPMEIVPVIGDAFNRYFPIFIALLCFSNTVGVYSRIVHCLGFTSLEFNETSNPDGGSDPVTEGKELVKLARRRHFENGLVELRNQASEARSLCVDGHGLEGANPEVLTSDGGRAESSCSSAESPVARSPSTQQLKACD